MKSSNHWKFLLVLIPIIGTFSGCTPCAAMVTANLVQTNKLAEVARGPGKPIAFFQATSFDIEVLVPDAAIPAGAAATFEVWKTPSQWAMALTNATISTNAVTFRATVADTSITGGVYRYTVRLITPSATTGVVDIAVLAHGTANVLTTPYGAIAGNPPTNGISITVQTTTYEGGGDLTALSNAVTALEADVPTRADSNLVWQTFARKDEVNGLGTDTTARAWAQSASNLAAAAYPASNPNNFVSANDLTGLGTDLTARAWAEAASNLASTAVGYGDHAAAGYVTTADAQTITGEKTFTGRTKFQPAGAFWISAASGGSRFGLTQLGSGSTTPSHWFGLNNLNNRLSVYTNEFQYYQQHNKGTFAYLHEVQKQNAVGAVSNMPVALLTQTSSNQWSAEAGAWAVRGDYTNGVMTLVEPGDYVLAPTKTNGAALITYYAASGIGATYATVDLYYPLTAAWVSNYAEGAIYAGTNVIDLALPGVLSNNPSVYLRYGGEIIPNPDGLARSLQVTGVSVTAWSVGDYVGQTNDAAGLATLVDDNITGNPRGAINQRALDNARTEARLGREAIDPSLVGVDLNYNELRFNHLWRARQTNETLRFTFDGHSMFEMTGGGTVTPVIVGTQFDGGTASIVVASATAWRPWLEYTTNLWSGWQSVPTNLYASTWPTLVNGTYTLSYTSIYPSAYYRALATSTNIAITGEAVFNVPIVGSASRMHSFPSTLLTVSAYQTSQAMTNTLLRVPAGGRTNVLVLIDGDGNITTQRILQVLVQ